MDRRSAPTADVKATVIVDGCKVGQPAARGAVRQSGDGVSWIEIALSELPDGEIELALNGRVGSASVGTSLPFVKANGAVTYPPTNLRRGDRVVTERDPRTGSTRSVLLHNEPDVECAR